jgi:hypothetical protein
MSSIEPEINDDIPEAADADISSTSIEEDDKAEYCANSAALADTSETKKLRQQPQPQQSEDHSRRYTLLKPS